MELNEFIYLNKKVFGVNEPKFRMFFDNEFLCNIIDIKLYNKFIYCKGINTIEFQYEDENNLVQTQQLNFKDYLCLYDLIKFVKSYDKQSFLRINNVFSLDYSNNVVLPTRYLVIEYDPEILMII